MLDFPYSPAEFRERYFERAPLLCEAALSTRPAGLADVDRTLDLIEPDERAVQLFDRGLIPQHTYTRDGVELGQPRRRLDKQRFYGHLRTGATLVLNRFEAHSSTASRLCSAISRFAGMQTTSNAYLSFTGTGTFGKHWDTHDVFAIQLIGRKRWQVFAPTFALPLSHQTSESFPQDAIGPVHLDLMLAPGDVLYLPRGWWHQAIPLDEASLHLSVGAYAATVNDYLLWMCSQWLPQQPLARQAFPPRGADGAGIGQLFDRLRTMATDASVIRQFQRELERREPHHSDIDLARNVSATSVAIEGRAIVRLTTSFTPRLDQPAILVNGQIVPLDALSYRIVDALRANASMSVDALHERIADVQRYILERALLALAQRDVLTLAH